MNTQLACDCFRAARAYVEQHCAEELEWVKGISPDLFDKMTCAHFLEDYCWVVYAAGFRVNVLTRKFPSLKATYCDFDIDRICGLPALHAPLAVINNIRKAEGFIDGCRRIRSEGFDCFKARVKAQGIEALQSLPFIGPVTKKHLARNIGLMDVPKDDVWLVRLAREFDAPSVDELASILAVEFKEKQGVVDLILWRFCADGAWDRWRNGHVDPMPDVTVVKTEGTPVMPKNTSTGRFLICQPDADVPPGLVAEELTSLGCEMELVQVHANQSASFDPDHHAGLVVLGGGKKSADDAGAYPVERSLIRQARATNKPIFGICLGGQLLAVECGCAFHKGKRLADTGFRRVALTEKGRSDPVLQNLASGVELYQYHYDSFDFPYSNSVEILATSTQSATPHCEAFRSGNAYGVVFHCEVTDQILRAWRVAPLGAESTRTARALIQSWIQLALGQTV